MRVENITISQQLHFLGVCWIRKIPDIIDEVLVMIVKAEEWPELPKERTFFLPLSGLMVATASSISEVSLIRLCVVVKG